MKIRSISLPAICVLFVAMLISGCGSGAGVSGGSGSGMAYYSPSSFPSINTPAPSTPIPGQGISSTTRGYVYTADTGTISMSKESSGQLIILPDNSSAPAGFVPASGVTVRIMGSSPLFTRTDSSGFFDFGTATTDTSGDIKDLKLVVESPSGTVTPVGYPVIGAPAAASSLTDLRIVPPYSDTGNPAMSMYAGRLEWFYIVGKAKDGWHTVSDTVKWSVSDQSLGKFLNYGIFISNRSLFATTKGTVTAQVGSSSLNLSVEVVGRGTIASVSGYVKSTGGKAVSSAIVEVMSDISSGNYWYGIQFTNYSGYYKISDVPSGTYKIRVKDLYGTELANESITINGNVSKDFTVSETLASVMAIVKTDRMFYSPGSVAKIIVNMTNMGSSDVSITYSAIKFDLVKTDYYTGTKTVIATTSATGGSVSLPSYRKTTVPATAVLLTIPSTTETNQNYSIEATLTTSSKLRVDPAYVAISTIITPTPLPSLSPFPTPSPTSSPGPSTKDDYYYLGQIKYKLGDTYYEVSDYANRAYSGEDVRTYVNSGSDVQYDLKYVRNWLMPSLKTVSYSAWQNSIDSIINDLDRYSNAYGTYNDLYSAASKISRIKREVESAQNSLRQNVVK